MEKVIEEMKNCIHRVFGIRGDETLFSVGESLPSSHDWDYENDRMSDEFLDGTCATGFKDMFWFDGEKEDIENIKEAIEFHKSHYHYKYTYIIGGDFYEYGADARELIIKNAVIVAVIE